MIRTLKYKELTFEVEVDEEDADILNGRSWWIDFNKKKVNCKYFRVRRQPTAAEKKSGIVSKKSLHHEVWEKHFGKVPDGMTIDHKDFNTLNNKKENLRLLPINENRPRYRKKARKVEQWISVCKKSATISFTSIQEMHFYRVLNSQSNASETTNSTVITPAA
jgi:hypothetical protein